MSISKPSLRDTLKSLTKPMHDHVESSSSLSFIHDEAINPQDYIEYQRMEEAVNLLRTSKKSIREIGREVGYKDTAYFCRRFKMMFGIPAGKMRRRESLMNL